MFVANLDLNYVSYCPTPEHFDSVTEYNEITDKIVEILAQTIHYHSLLKMQGIDVEQMLENTLEQM